MKTSFVLLLALSVLVGACIAAAVKDTSGAKQVRNVYLKVGVLIEQNHVLPKTALILLTIVGSCCM
jgi:hypothetical protein